MNWFRWKLHKSSYLICCETNPNIASRDKSRVLNLVNFQFGSRTSPVFLIWTAQWKLSEAKHWWSYQTILGRLGRSNFQSFWVLMRKFGLKKASNIPTLNKHWAHLSWPQVNDCLSNLSWLLKRANLEARIPELSFHMTRIEDWKLAHRSILLSTDCDLNWNKQGILFLNRLKTFTILNLLWVVIWSLPFYRFNQNQENGRNEDEFMSHYHVCVWNMNSKFIWS